MDFITLNTFALLLLSHLLGDVIFTSHDLALLKRNPAFLPQFLGLGCHSSVHAVFAGFILFFGGRFWLKGALLVFVLHFLIDFIRCRIEIRLFGPGRIYVKRTELMEWVSGAGKDSHKMNIKNLWPWLLINILDQVTHCGTLYCIALTV